MPVRRRSDKRRAEIDEDGAAWLRGEPNGFFEFKPTLELEDFWRRYGNTNLFFWECGMTRPIVVNSLPKP